MSKERGATGISITMILMGGIGGIVIAGLALTFWLGFSVAMDNTTILLRQRASGLIDDITREIRRQILPAAENSRFTAAYYATLGRMPTGEDAIHLSTAMALVPQLRFSGFFAPDGSAFLYQRNGEFSQDTWIEDPQIARIMREMSGAEDLQWQGPLYSVPLKQTVIPVTIPVRRDGKFLGFAGTAVSTRELSRFVDSLDVPGGAAFILHGREHVIAHPILIDGLLEGIVSPRTPLLNTVQTGDRVLAAFRNNEGQELFILENAETDLKGAFHRIDDEDYVLLYREIRDFGPVPWLVGSYLKLSEVEENRALVRLQVSAWVGLGLMAVTLVFLVLIARRIRRPILDLATASLKVRDLDFEPAEPAAKSFVRELNQAGDAFQRMLQGLRLFETYVPKTLVLRLLRADQTTRVAPEERMLTVMFTDIAGFTSMAERMSAAETAELLNGHFRLLNTHVEHENGTVDKYIGDSMMAFWGAPEAQEDHAARGCRAVLGIAKAIVEDNKRRVERGESPLRIRIGLHSGPAIAGNIGAPGRVNYTVVGDTVNVANRLEQFGKEIAPDDDVVILVSGETTELAGAAFRLSKVGAFTPRGREAALVVYRLRENKITSYTKPR